MDKELPAQLTPLERLARSREAIASSISGHDAEDTSHDDLGAEWGQDVIGQHVKPGGGKPRRGWWPVFTSLASTWWHRHPLNAVAHMAKPVIAGYARQQPVRLLGAAALLGAVVVIARPWRLVSAGALLMAALRPSEISAFAMTMLSSFNSTLQKDKEQRETRRRDT